MMQFEKDNLDNYSIIEKTYSLGDFLDIENADIMERAAQFHEKWWSKMYNEKHLLYRREALSPSAPIPYEKNKRSIYR